MVRLSSTFARKSPVIRSRDLTSPLTDDQIRSVVPSIFAEEKHTTRSDKYTYVPTRHVLAALRKEGFEPFFACQSRSRDAGQFKFTKHMLRLRHTGWAAGKDDTNEIILINSHNGTSSYQMLAGCFRFVCQNGMVCGDVVEDIRIPHRGDIVDNVIEGSYRVLKEFELVDEHKEGMKATRLSPDEQKAFARSALGLKYDEPDKAPIRYDQLLSLRRRQDDQSDLWTTLNITQENLLRGGLRGRTANNTRTTTREVGSIDANVRINRALWTLAEEMKKLKGEGLKEAA